MNRPFPVCLCILTLCGHGIAQIPNAAQQVVLQGLRTANSQGSFRAAKYAADGSLYLLYDQGDGVRVLKSDASGSTVLAQAFNGTTGDTGIAMALDPLGNVYVTGTTTSNAISGTNGAAFPNRADASTNSFLAKYDANLNLIFLTFLGSGRTAASGVAATTDAVFVTGITFSTSFPVTPAGIQQAPALNSSENGFVERFNVNGSLLAYATYVTGVNGNTVPTAIVADASDNAYIAGSTSSTGYPTIAALQPTILGANSGFLSRLTPAGDGFVYSTFIAGSGITSMALDATSSSLLLTGNISSGQFPLATVSMPLTSATYQTMLRIPFDGQSVTSSVLLVPGSQSYVSAGPNGDAWISGSLATPLFPGEVPPDYNSGDSFLLHVTSTNTFDQTLRFGGTPINNLSYASLTSTVAAPAINGTSVSVPGTVQASLSSALLATQHFDLPQVQTSNSALLPNTIHDALPVAANCNSQCSGTAGLLAIVSTATSSPSLSLSTDDMPNLTLRNLGSSTATGLVITVAGFSAVTDCGSYLAPSNKCSINLNGSGPGMITVRSTNTSTVSAALGSNSRQPDTIQLSETELDFGIATSTSPSMQMFTISNIGASSQTFTSEIGSSPNAPATIIEYANDCVPSIATGSYTLAANSTCHVTLSLNVFASTSSDGPIAASWRIGTHEIALKGYAQKAQLNVSATEIDFGMHFSTNGAPGGINLPRYLYISNNAATVFIHTPVTSGLGSAFTVEDGCPAALEAHSVCQIKVTYSPASSLSQDAVTLSLDSGLSVLLTGTTLPSLSTTGSSTNPSLSVSTTTVNFSTPVIVTGISTAPQNILVRNSGASPFALGVSTSGDFQLTNGCPNQLPGGASCNLMVSFLPSQPGTRFGLLSLTAGTGFSTTYISLSGSASPIVPANNGMFDLGDTLSAEPTVAWYKVQQPLPALSVSSNNGAFAVALLADTGNGHGALPASEFSSSTTAACGNCWLGVQLLSQSTGMQTGLLSFSTVAGGQPYVLVLSGTVLPVEGLLLAPHAQDFGTINVDSASAPLTFALANLVASETTITVQSVTTTGDFTVVPNQTGGASCTGTLAPTASCFVQLAFSPTTTDLRAGTLEIITSAGTVHATLSGFGATDPGVSISSAELDFLNTPGSNATQQSLVISNTSSSSLTIGPVATSASSFAASSNCGALTPSSVCSITVNFAPQSAMVSATLSIPVTVTINGQTTTTVYTVALDGGYTAEDAGLQILPTEVNFGAINTGTVGGTRQFTLNNLSGKQLSVTLHMPQQFPLTTAPACTSLEPGGSCTFSISFLPVIEGPITGSVYADGISSDGLTSAEALAYMQGYGLGRGTLVVQGFPVPYSPVNFGQVASGQSLSQTMTLSNSSYAPVSIHRISSAPPFLSTNTCGSILNSGDTCTVTITYAPVYQIGSGASSLASRNDSETLIIESDAASSPDMIPLIGLAAPLITTSPSNSATLAAFTLSQYALTFGNTQVGNISATQVVTMTNTGTTPLHIGSVVAPIDFIASTNCATLSVGASCQITVRLAPSNISTSKVRSGALQIVSDASPSLEFVSLLGTSSAAPLNLYPTSLSFGSVNVGSTVTLGLSLTNTASSPITFLGYIAGGDYSVTSGTCPAYGSVLAAGSSCSLSLNFTPSTAGTRAGLLTLTTDATTLPLTVALSGTGLQPAASMPSFTLTVSGSSTATLMVVSGSPAAYNLLLTPANGFTGLVALTCTPIVAATYASCSLLSSTLTLNGSALTSTATINTITTAAFRSGVGVATLLLGSIAFWRRRGNRWCLTVTASMIMVFLYMGCGSSSKAPTSSNVQRTPPGTYQYKVTASSTTGTVVSSTVTLNLIVQ